jgi:hypothetical protein
MIKTDEPIDDLVLSSIFPPFHYNEKFQMIFDSTNQVVIDIRFKKFSFLADTIKVQNSFGEMVVRLLNEKYYKDNTKKETQELFLLKEE